MSWEYKTLDQLGTISRGKSKHRPRNDPALYGGTYPFIQTADVKNANFYITEYSQTYNEKGLSQSKLWNKGTLCITIAANIADTAILGIDACFPDSIMGFIPFENVSDVRFVKYCFDILQKNCQQISQGATQDNLSWEKLSTIKFPAPHLEIQNRIANILSTYDDLIENNQKQIKLLEEAAQRLYKEWFVDLRFPGHENTKIVDSVPEGWKKCVLADLCERINAGGTPNRKKESYWNNATIKWYKTQELQDCWLIDSDEKISIEGQNNSSAKFFPENTILMAIYASPTLGRLGVLDSEATCNQAALCLKADETIISWQWLYGKLYELRDHYNGIARGAGQQNISGEVVKQTEVICPEIELIKKYTKIVFPLFEKQRKLQKETINLKEARDRLLPKLMSGELEV